MNNGKTGMLTVLRNRDFLALWVSQLISKIGDNFAVVAALVLINNVARASGFALIAIGVAVTLPQLFALASGVLIDRFSRKTVMIVTDVLRAGVILLALLVQEPGDLWILYLVAFGVMGLGAVYIPARNASVPNMVSEEHLLTANALIQATELVSLIVGSSLATLVISLTSTDTAFVVDAGTFAVSGLVLLAARIPQGRLPASMTAPRGEFRRFWDAFVEGLRYIRSNKHLLQLMAITTMATLGLSATVLLAAFYFSRIFGLPTALLGLLQAMEGIGMALGAVLISVYASWARSRQIVSVTMIVLGAGILVFATAPAYWLVLAGALIVGLCVVSARTTLAAMTQALVPDAQRGRVESAMVTVIGFGTMGALIMAGILGDVMGPKSVFVVTGIVVLIAGVASIFALRGAEQRLLNGVDIDLPPPFD
ncbi:MAG TPA: MFS transporter [Anaerolineae bacterium]|nr:MFS transporter [Anaerolineae bacterium]